MSRSTVMELIEACRRLRAHRARLEMASTSSEIAVEGLIRSREWQEENRDRWRAFDDCLERVDGTLAETKARAFALDTGRPIEVVIRVPVTDGYVCSAALIPTPKAFRESDGPALSSESLPMMFGMACQRLVSEIRKKMLAIDVGSN